MYVEPPPSRGRYCSSDTPHREATGGWGTGDGGDVVAESDGSPYLIFCCNVHGLTTSRCGRIGGLKAVETV